MRVDEKGAVGFFEENFRPLPIRVFYSSCCGQIGREFHLYQSIELDVKTDALYRNRHFFFFLAF